MESLIDKENELRKLAESGEYEDVIELADFLSLQGRDDEAEEYYRKLAEIDEYWGVHLLGDFLCGQKRYEEAKEQYLKIAGPNDLSGDANSHLFQMLLDMGEYEEALKYYGYIKNCCDTAPAEGAYVRMAQELRNPESKIFMYFDEESFYYECLPLICDVRLDKLSQFMEGEEEADDCGDIETGDQYLQNNIETILLTRTKSDNEEIKKGAKIDLLWLYLEGRFRFGDFSWKCSKRNVKNIKKAIKASIVFAEYPDIIDEPYCDWGYFLTVVDTIHGENIGGFAKALERVKRFVIAILKHAEKLGNIEEVLNKIESEIFHYYNYEEYGNPFYLGYLPKGLSRVPAIAFAADIDSENEELESIVIPDTVKTISEGAFWWCTSLTNIVIPNSVTKIEDNAFVSCKSLTSIVIPESITSIGDSAFVGCMSLTSIVIPTNVTSIVDNAFEDAGLGEDGEGIITIKGYAGSYAETYAKENGIPFEEIKEK